MKSVRAFEEYMTPTKRDISAEEMRKLNEPLWPELTRDNSDTIYFKDTGTIMPGTKCPEPQLHIRTIPPAPKATWQLRIIGNSDCYLQMTGTPPNMFRRWVYRVVFGFQVTVLEEK